MKEKKVRNRKKRFLRFLCILAGIMLAVLAVFQTVRVIGRENIKKNASAAAPDLSQSIEQQSAAKETAQDTDAVKWQKGWVKYQDEIYAYNEDIMTFLFMGIDKENDVKEEKGETNGGQADALFLLVLNPHDNSAKIIGINRNAMADVDMYGDDGAYQQTIKAQIAVQHGFGNGLEESCEYQVKAVERFLYQLPIHGYCAVNMEAVISLNDEIGGVDLVALDDIYSVYTDYDSMYQVIEEGEEVHLDGLLAYCYVRYRNIEIPGSADGRLERQKQYLEKFVQKAKTQMASDISLPIRLYSEITSKMVTDVSLDEVTYLASVAKDYSFSKEDIYTLEGETVRGEKFEEFYVDEDALYDLILDVFYEPVSQ